MFLSLPLTSAASSILRQTALFLIPHSSVCEQHILWTERLNAAPSLRSFSFDYDPSPSRREETALSPAARLLGIDAPACGGNNSALTAIKIDFKGRASPNRRRFSQELSLTPAIGG